ncbi:MAG TPA: exopolysaccharide biosynthesis polyprenyl glycosylphosphotransferase [Candidatus Sulfotelmatobacter sp.]|jgi:Undecaprenyl-phosphate glucose phosphotransferase|nr:exopolysaccharide biosynthesis polyprenyl glycosylphosphotransferase [Candidatus Sulfotelmatobacter sp.]
MILRLKYYRFCLRVITYLLPFLAFELGWETWTHIWNSLGRLTDFDSYAHFRLLAVATLVWAALAEHYGVTNVDELFRERTGLRAALAANAANSAVLLAALFFSQDLVFPRGLFALWGVLLLILTVSMRTCFRVYVRLKVGGGKPLRLLVVGADKFAHAAVLRLQKMPLGSCQVAGFVRLPGQLAASTDKPVHELEALGELDVEQGIDEAVIAIDPAEFNEIPKILKALEHLRIPMRAIVDLGEGIVVRERLFQLGRMQMLDLTTTPAESLDYNLLKRAFDIVFSTSVLIVTAPALALIMLGIRCTSPGPVFFSQDRVGLNGKLFHMLKFRTMKVCECSESDTHWTTENDSGRTRVGAFLRKTSLDELPQFINVLKGDMSVVGPRPERPHFVQKFLNDITRYNNRHWLKAGITGWAQVNGWRGDTSIQKRLEYDLYYLQNWSFFFDLRIIVLTVLSAMIGRNAY